MPKTKSISKVAIVGYAPTCQKTPFDRDDMHFWGMNDLWTVLPQGHWHAWFDMHHEHVMKANPRTGEKHWNWLKGVNFPVYTLDKVEEVSQSVAYPLDECAAVSRKYFTSTPAYMMALAILQGYKEIHVYGINLMGDEEYAFQKPCFEYWCGFAEGKGIKVVVAEGATILGAPALYGYDTHGAEVSRLEKLIIDKHLEHEAKRRQCELQKAALDGACEAMAFFRTMAKQDRFNGLLPDANKPLPVMTKLATEHLKGWHEQQPESSNGQESKPQAAAIPAQVVMPSPQPAQTKENE